MKNNFKTILIGFKSYSTLEFENYRLLFDVDYALKFKSYVESWGLDEESVFDELLNSVHDLIGGKYNKRNDLPTRFSESSRLGTTTNLLNGIKVQFTEDTLFGKEYTEIQNIYIEDEQMVHFWY